MEIQANGIASPYNLPQSPNVPATEIPREARSVDKPVKESQSSEKQDDNKAKPSLQEVENATEQVKKFVSPVNNDIQFSIDKETGINVVKVVDRTTNEIIRQIPSDEILQIAKALDRLQGLLVKQKA